MSKTPSAKATVKTACPYCGVGCGVVATTNNDGNIEVSGDKQHPANFGKLCSKGLALADTLNDDGRLLHPTIEGASVSWDVATSQIASSLKNTIREFGSESIGFYVSGQLLTEDYYVVNKFVKGWLGTANIDTNSRLCMASSVAGHKRAFGTDTVPGCYEDLDSAELIVLVGSNLAWCHPVLYQRIMDTKAKRPELTVVVIDPRNSITASNADLHLQIQPDGDTLLFNALLHHLHTQGATDTSYIDQHVEGFDQALAQAATAFSPQLSEQLGVSKDELEQFFTLFTRIQKTITVYSQGVNQSRTGTDKVSAIINCHLATGRIGKPGMGPFSITGQPNAMGGREVGGLATMLACHRDLENTDHQAQVQTFWQSPAIANKPGLTAVDMFRAVQSGKLKAIWIMATNPVDSLPEADTALDALKRCPLVIVSEVTRNSDTLACANIALPAQAFGEKEGTVTNSERRISRQRRIKTPAGEAMPDWWAISRVAQKMGYTDAFNYETPAQIFTEYAALSAFENEGTVDFNIGGCADLSDDEYNTLAPFQWPCLEKPATNNSVAIRFFGAGQFYTPDKRARMISVQNAIPGNNTLSDSYPLILNTGRIRDQWHTMTRTGYIPRLMGHRAEPFIEINPSDALIHGIKDADIVQIDSQNNKVLARSMLSDRQTPGQVFIPMHWSSQFASLGRVNTLVEAHTDPTSRQPAFKNQAVSIRRFAASSYAFLLTRQQPYFADNEPPEYWASAPLDEGWRSEVASSLSLDELTAQLTRAAYHPCEPDSAEIPSPWQPLEYTGNNSRRLALFEPYGRLYAMLYVSTSSVELSRSWAMTLLTKRYESLQTRWQLMAGRAPSDQPDKGAIVCSCFSVGDKEIVRSIRNDGCCTVDKVGKKLSAGTNCGSCRNEIDVLIKRYQATDQSIPTH